MQGAIIIDYGEMGKLPIHELEKPLSEKFIALKVITGYGFDNTCARISDIFGNEYAFSLDRDRSKHGSIRYKELMKRFPDKVRGQTIDTHKVFYFHLWDYTGHRSLYTRIFWVDDYKKPIPDDVRMEYEAVMDKYSKGLMSCSDCGHEISNSIKNQYFASRYCDDCWLGKTGKHKDQGGWKKVEANESYD